jgi:hypothetical protein
MRMMRAPGLNVYLRYIVACFSLIMSSGTMAGETLDYFPRTLDEGEKYIVYLHGKIIEDKGTRPTHPIFGVYEYQDILAGFAARGYTVISEVREPNTDPQQYADYVSEHIRRYRKNGDTELSVVGFSKGAVITLLVSSRLDYADIRYAILAGCWPSIVQQRMQLSGRVLSLYDVSDSVGSCRSLADKSSRIEDFHEETFDTGESHGLFFKPNPIWLEPLFTWLKTT